MLLNLCLQLHAHLCFGAVHMIPVGSVGRAVEIIRLPRVILAVTSNLPIFAASSVAARLCTECEHRPIPGSRLPRAARTRKLTPCRAAEPGGGANPENRILPPERAARTAQIQAKLEQVLYL